MEVRIQQKSTNWCGKCCSFFRDITVEPVIIGTMFVIIMYSMLQKEYIYSRISIDYNLTTDGRDKSCNKSMRNTSDPDYLLEQKVQSETSKWILYLFVTTFVAAALSSVLLGAWSDKIGRKFPLLISSFGFFILIAMYVAVVNLYLPVPVLLIGHFLCGLLGDMGTVMGCSFAHIVDISATEKRTFRMAVIEATSGVGGLIASLSGGAWVKETGFVQPFWFILAVTAFNIIYVAFRLESTHEGSILSNLRFLFTKKPFVHMYQVIKKQEDDTSRHICIILYVACYFIAVLVFGGIRDILIIYAMGSPFCWGFMLIGISLGISNLTYIVSIVLIKLFPSVSSEFRLVMVGAATGMIACIVLALSSTTWMIFLGLILQLPHNLPAPIIKSQLSRVVSQSEVGSIFGLFSLAYNISMLCATFLFNGVYSATVKSSLPGATFLIGTAMFVIFLPLYIWAYRLSYKSISSSYTQIQEPLEDEEIN